MFTRLKAYLARRAGRALAKEGARQRAETARQRRIALHDDLRAKCGLPPMKWAQR